MYTPVIDDCTRADENPLSNGGLWANAVMFAGDFKLKLATNTIQAAGASSASQYTTNRYGPDCEMYCVTTTTEGGVDLIGRLHDPNTAGQVGYWVNFDLPGDLCTIYYLQGLTIKTVQLRRTTAVCAAGDQLGFQMFGNTIYALVNGVVVNQVNDSRLTTAGYLGIAKFSTQSPFTSVGGGTLGTMQPLDTSLYPRTQLDAYALTGG